MVYQRTLCSFVPSSNFLSHCEPIMQLKNQGNSSQSSPTQPNQVPMRENDAERVPLGLWRNCWRDKAALGWYLYVVHICIIFFRDVHSGLVAKLVDSFETPCCVSHLISLETWNCSEDVAKKIVDMALVRKMMRSASQCRAKDSSN